MNKIAKAGLSIAGQVALGQLIVFATFVTVGVAGNVVDDINKKKLKKELLKGRAQALFFLLRRNYYDTCKR